MLLGAAPKLVVTGMAEPEAVAAPLRSDLVYGGFIRGLRYYDYPKVHRKLKKGTLVDLRRELDNPHDRYAIEVWFGEHKLGYLPRAENKTLSHLLDLGLTFETQIRYVDPDKKNVWDGVYVKVFGEVGKVAEGDGVWGGDEFVFWGGGPSVRYPIYLRIFGQRRIKTHG